jgi:hypothetical protein
VLDFPICRASRERLPTLPRTVPRSFLAPFDDRVCRTHGARLEVLARCGGLSWVQVAKILEPTMWTDKHVRLAGRDEAGTVMIEAMAAARVLTLIAAG